ncbi:NlpC/P60 family protein [Jeongeupia sp. HS-3]|uniref:NlpC/P60 family protein n=1 Tax=Jeongeupia sp. HS-3 TaxID=1009682 RepID=UPI001F1EACF7|nr:NlpC/P60 family protein [Jeongeupia sp. HS-3]
MLQAMSLIGVRYQWGGNTPEEGLDCSGFIRYVFQNSLNITLPRTAASMSQSGQNVNKGDLKPGDLVFFNTLGRAFSHVGIYLGDNRFIHSPRAGKSVEVSNIQQNYWQQRWNGARRIAGASGNGINMTTLLASAGNSKARKAASVAPVVASADRQCRKVTTGKGRNKKTTTVCERTSVTKPTATRSSGKALTSKSAAKTPAKSAAKSTKKSTTAKSSAKGSTKKTTAKGTTKSTTKSAGKPAKPPAKKKQ